MTVLRALSTLGLATIDDEALDAYDAARARGEAPGFAGVFLLGLRETWRDRAARHVLIRPVAIVLVFLYLIFANPCGRPDAPTLPISTEPHP